MLMTGSAGRADRRRMTTCIEGDAVVLEILWLGMADHAKRRGRARGAGKGIASVCIIELYGRIYRCGVGIGDLPFYHFTVADGKRLSDRSESEIDRSLDRELRCIVRHNAIHLRGICGIRNKEIADIRVR